MALPIYPELPGRVFEVEKTPIWSTGVQTSQSGVEYRWPRWSYPVWDIEVEYEFLRNRSAAEDLKALWGFYCERKGAASPFLFKDPEDNSAEGILIGVGDGARTAFQLSRPMANFREPFRDISGQPVVYLDGLIQAAGWTLAENGVVVFDAAPALGQQVSADFSYFFRVRFLEDRLSAARFANQLWSTGRITLRSLKA